MRRFGLLGRTLVHSFSTAYFGEKFRREGIDAEYRNYELPDISLLPPLIRENPDLCGLNVTIPYKQSVIPYLDELDYAAAEIGAVNVVVIERREGRVVLRGYNTDAPGFLESARFCLSDNNPVKALLLGTGGASLAVKYALENVGVLCTRVSRTPVAGEYAYGDIDEDVVRHTGILVNCTPLGTYPDVGGCPPFPYQYLCEKHVAIDLVYNPPCTQFMQRCAAQGCVVRNGLSMLYRQAELAWKLWNS